VEDTRKLRLIIDLSSTHSKDEFKRDMAEFFNVFSQLMAQKAEWLIGAQTLAIRHFTRYVKERAGLYIGSYNS